MSAPDNQDQCPVDVSSTFDADDDHIVAETATSPGTTASCLFHEDRAVETSEITADQDYERL